MLAPFNAGTMDGERPREWIKNTAGCRGVITYLYTTKNRLTYIQIKIINLIQTILNKVEEKNKREIIERKKSKQKDFVKFGLEYFVINKFWKEKSWCKIFVQAKI